MFPLVLEGLTDMKRVGLYKLFCLALAVLCVASGSCRQHEATSPKTAAGTALKPPAEESFDLIMETFRRRIEETPIGFVISDGSGRSTLTGTNKVSYELVRPATPADSYKAIITVVSHSNYSIKRTKENHSEDGRDKSHAGDSATAPGAGADTEYLSTGKAQPPPTEAAPEKASAAPADDVVARRPEEEIRKYELLYKDGRWILTTTLNKDTEQSIQNAFNSALANQ